MTAGTTVALLESGGHFLMLTTADLYHKIELTGKKEVAMDGEKSIGPVEALELALAREKASIELYKKLAAEHKVAEEIFTLLFNEENKHKKLIENKIFELTK